MDNECDRCVEYNYTFFFLLIFLFLFDCHFHLSMATHKGAVTLAFTFHRQTDSMSCVFKYKCIQLTQKSCSNQTDFC